MREILFRGKRTDNKKWVFGDLHTEKCSPEGAAPWESASIYEKEEGAPWRGYIHDVIPNSVGQFTGILDANGTMIFEGDIVKIRTKAIEISGEVVFADATFYVHDGDSFECLWYYPEEIEVIGNIFGNANSSEGGAK